MNTHLPEKFISMHVHLKKNFKTPIISIAALHS